MRIKSTPITWFAVLLVITCLLAILVPANPTSLHALQISEAVYRLVMLTLMIPYAIIWFAAFYGYDQLAKYSRSLIFTGEGKAFQKVARGLGVLAWGLIMQVLLSIILNAISLNRPGFDGIRAAIDEYFSLAIALVTFVFIENGTYELVQLVRAHHSHTVLRWIVILGALIGALFQHVMLQNQAAGRNQYHLSVYPLIFTIIVPYVFTWITAIISVYELNLYATRVKGLLYKRALQFLANGLSIVILLSVAVQFIDAATAPGSSSSLATILLFDYLLLAAVACGFVLVALGAKRLKRIEEV